MRVVLLERVEKLGQMGDVVRVRDGFARNYLLPQHKALRATEDNLKRFERERVQLEARNLERRSEAEGVAGRMNDVSIVLVRQASDMGQLYGSVNARDVSEALSADGYQVERRQVVLDRAIKSLGIHEVRVSLHPEVAVTVKVNVARSQEEAALQAQGIDVLAEAREEFEPEEAEVAETETEPAEQPAG
jgi:large subunit ribosomal protein L9